MLIAKNSLGDRFTVPTEENFHHLYDFCISHMTAGYEAP